ncbi:CAP domain-containing protein [Saccharothrix sp. NRRL B-16348]|uniref:CAP domain-containing protein n=1 Tax=Saccharothrix sp. NRRL B-16348 TaxID=1415542 RepID=UPI0006AE26A1|nr:CAP domain-containing protein [Saccharothrix sp. NRRL B-16348]
MSRKSSVLPVAVVLAGLALAGCEHPDGMALVAASASATIRTTPQPGAASTTATTTADTTPSAPATTTPEQPPATTTTTATTTVEPPKQAQVPVEPPAPVAPTRTEVEVAEAKVVELTNGERAAHGCPALAADDRLATAARAHSADMAAQNYFDHVSKDGRSFVDRVKAAGYPAPGAENIAAGQRTAEAVVKGWMDSPGHRANILNCKLKTLGVGMARGGSYGIYWTQNFGW